MALPDFLIIGAQKGGTTWLAYQLRQHPDVFMPPREVHFFDNARNFDKGLTWYERHFDDGRGRRVIGEKTPEYSWVGGRGPGHLPEVHRNIRAALPEVRLIMILRNPVDRAISHLTHLIRAGQVGPMERVDDLLVGSRRGLVADIGVIERGRYVRQVAAFRELFDPQQLLILVYEEDVRAEPRTGLTKTCRFLGIDPSIPAPTLDRKRNAADRSRARLLLDYYIPPLRPYTWRLDRWLTPWKGAPSEHATRELHRVYAEDNAKLFELLGREIPPSWSPGTRPVAAVDP